MSLDPITSVIDLVSTVVGKIWPDKTEAEKEAFMLSLQSELDRTQLLKSQADTNAIEAANPNLFVSGWRPWIGWGLGSIVIFYAFLTLVVNFSVAFGLHVTPMPSLDPMVRDIVLSLLGINVLARSYEKGKGVARNSMSDS